MAAEGSRWGGECVSALAGRWEGRHPLLHEIAGLAHGGDAGEKLANVARESTDGVRWANGRHAMYHILTCNELAVHRRPCVLVGTEPHTVSPWALSCVAGEAASVALVRVASLAVGISGLVQVCGRRLDPAIHRALISQRSAKRSAEQRAHC